MPEPNYKSITIGLALAVVFTTSLLLSNWDLLIDANIIEKIMLISIPCITFICFVSYLVKLVFIICRKGRK